MPTVAAVTLPVEACEGVREEVMKAKEQAILTLGTTLAKNNAPEGNDHSNLWFLNSIGLVFRAWGTD